MAAGSNLVERVARPTKPRRSYRKAADEPLSMCGQQVHPHLRDNPKGSTIPLVATPASSRSRCASSAARFFDRRAVVTELLFAGSSLDKAKRVFDRWAKHRPRIRMTIRQRTRVLQQWPPQ
jgi:hypothetical protein